MAGTTTTAPLSGEGEGCAHESVRGYPRKAEDRIATTFTLVYNGRQNRDAVRMASPARAVATGRGCSGILSLYTGSPKHGAARMLPLSHRLLRTDGRIVQPTGRSSGKRQTGSLSVNKEDAAAVAWVEQPPLELAGYLSVYKELSKIKLSGLVVLTTMVGYAMAPGEFSGTELFLTTLGTSFCVASANTLNQVCGNSIASTAGHRPHTSSAATPLPFFFFLFFSFFPVLTHRRSILRLPDLLPCTRVRILSGFVAPSSPIVAVGGGSVRLANEPNQKQARSAWCNQPAARPCRWSWVWIGGCWCALHNC